MADDMILNERFVDALAAEQGISDVKMMGGRCFLHNGNMIGGVKRTKDGVGQFMFRVGPDRHEEALAREGAQIMPMGNRIMRGIIMVLEDDLDDEGLRGWIAYTLAFTKSLPPKPMTRAAHAIR